MQHDSQRRSLPATPELRRAFSQEVVRLGGRVSAVHDLGLVLFMRSVLPRTAEVRPGDEVCAGVAMRTTPDEISVHPYVYRRICQNGAIQPMVTDAHRVGRVDLAASNEQIEAVLEDVREAVHACARADRFDHAVDGMQRAAVKHADMNLLLALPPQLIAEVLLDIARQFTAEDDRTGFGLMNAVTSVARDTRDPERRWRLEELGGGVPALLTRVRSPSGAAAFAGA